MKDPLMNFQIRTLERQLRLLKSKTRKKGKNFSSLYGTCGGKMDFSLAEIKEHQFSLKTQP